MSQQQQAAGHDENNGQEVASKIEVGKFFDQKQGSYYNEHDAPKGISKVHGCFFSL